MSLCTLMMQNSYIKFSNANKVISRLVVLFPFDDVLLPNYPHPHFSGRSNLIARSQNSHLDHFLKMDTDGRLQTRIYHKRYDITFPISVFQYLNYNIQSSVPYGIYLSQLIRWAGAHSHYTDFFSKDIFLTLNII